MKRAAGILVAILVMAGILAGTNPASAGTTAKPTVPESTASFALDWNCSFTPMAPVHYWDSNGHKFLQGKTSVSCDHQTYSYGYVQLQYRRVGSTTWHNYSGSNYLYRHLYRYLVYKNIACATSGAELSYWRTKSWGKFKDFWGIYRDRGPRYSSTFTTRCM